MPNHTFERISQEVTRRTLNVVSTQQLTPRMLRICFQSEQLAGFQSPSADDHIKIFLPATERVEAASRHFTPRAWMPEENTLVLDFALHPHGPAVEWAVAARPGDTLEIAGPRGSNVAPSDFDWYLLIGDATALPSIARRTEELPPNAEVVVIALVEDQKESRYLQGPIGDRAHWLRSTGSVSADRELLLDCLSYLTLPQGDGFIWIAAETSVARAAYRYAVDVLAHRRDWIKAAGYWTANEADGGERIA